MKKIVIASLAGLIATATFASSAMASPFCQQYAQKAVFSEQENLWQGCGLFGPSWSFDYAGHYAWCMIVPKWTAQQQTNFRKWSLVGC